MFCTQNSHFACKLPLTPSRLPRYLTLLGKILPRDRVGKTEGAGGFELALHLTGRYPDWWAGRRFDRPVSAWACGDIGYFTAKGNEIVLQDYQGDFSVEVELGVGPQEKMQQAQVLKEAILFAARVGVPSGFQSMEHVAKMYDRMGRLLGTPMEGYHYSAQELAQRDRLKEQMQRMGDRMQQMGQYIQQLQGALQDGQKATATGTGMPGRLPG